MNELCVIEAVNVVGIVTASTAVPLQHQTFFAAISNSLCSRAPLHDARYAVHINDQERGILSA